MVFKDLSIAMRVVAIDQGTTSTRALVLEGPGRGKIVATRTHAQHYPHLGWVEHDPLELLRHVRECLSAAGPADAIGLGNQGESCLGWNRRTGAWDADLCALFGVPIEALPEIVPTMGDFGVVDVDGRPTPLTASAVDQQAALFGHGCRTAGDAKITFGTGAFALALTGMAAGLWEEPNPEQSTARVYHLQGDQTSGSRLFAKAVTLTQGWNA